jgi:hypothetical protein
MASTPAEIAARGTTSGIDLTCVSKAHGASADRRRAYELGFRQSEARVATARHQAERWKAEAAWWKEEYAREHAEFCEFVAYVADKYGLSKP